ncbi:MAG: poly-beta,6-N-acetyl-D-glucosamine synthase [Candidatus Woesearchaeota archaeon]|nr:poly-beta,6-N-acetyl-D-glucosamine synthase [Candidatus Woesearchaeota archaeon]
MITITRIILDVVYFISLYYAVFWLLTYIEEKPKEKPKRTFKEWPAVSIVIPMYNEEENIRETIQTTCKLDYPSDKLKIYVVDDGSKDNSLEIARITAEEEMKKNPQLEIKILHQENKGKYAAVNNALDYIDTPFFATLDADSYPEKDALKNLLQEFTTQKVGAVSPILKVKNPQNIIEKIQWYEYAINHFYKSVIALRNAIHVTPGPLSVYRTELVKRLGKFREGHKTEDMELGMRIQAANYEIKQCEEAVVYTKAPRTWKSLTKQRVRWNLGSTLNIKDYSKMLFNKNYGDFGIFQLPMIPMAGVLSVSILFLIIFNLRDQIKRSILVMKTYNFNIFEYIAESISHFNLEFWFLNLSLKNIVMMIIFFSVSVFILYKGIKLFNEKVDNGWPALFLFLFMYYFFIAWVWILVFKDMIFKKEVRWK